MSTPRPFGDELAQAVRKYLSDNAITQSKLTGEILADIGQRFYDHYQAKQTAKKKRGEAPPEDVAVYESYPRKVGRMDALAAIRVARESHPTCDLLNRTQEFSRAVKRWPANYRYKEGFDMCPYPATWFRAGRYLDDPKEWLPAGLFTREDDPQETGGGLRRTDSAKQTNLTEPAGWEEEFPDAYIKVWKDIPEDSKKIICDHMNKVRA